MTATGDLVPRAGDHGSVSPSAPAAPAAPVTPPQPKVEVHAATVDGAAPSEQGHPQRWLVLIVVLAGQFMIIGGVGTMNIALPSIRDDLGASSAAMQWVVVLYQIGYAVLLVTGGRLGDLFGRKRVFLVGLAGFVVASALAACAPNAGLLIAARLLQGVFGGVTSPQVLAVIQVAFPPAERARAFAAFGMVGGSAFMVGQFMSGALIELDLLGLSWREPFVVNLVLGAVALVVAIRVLPETGTAQRQRLDLAGMVLASAGGLLLLYPLIQGRNDGWPPLYFVLLAAAVPVLAGFVRFEQRLRDRGGDPLVDPTLFRSRSFRAGLVAAITFSFGAFPTFYVLTLTLQFGFDFDPLQAALATAATPITVIAISFLSARLLPRFGRRIVAAAGVFGCAAALALIATMTWAPRPLSGWSLIPALMLLGCNNGLGMVSIVNLTLADVAEEHAGAASGVFQTVQQASSAIGVAIAGIIFFGVLADATTEAAHVDAFRATLLFTIVAALSMVVLHRMLPAAPRRDTVTPDQIVAPDPSTP